ncbi:hypothetical protein XOCgx_3129 [Xanthomonas oryzae pv. oryzicola]|nr:hypothetical protein XOCgx_3129 [Xanthomonas oryzae pv. oryzicola]
MQLAQISVPWMAVGDALARLTDASGRD